MGRVAVIVTGDRGAASAVRAGFISLVPRSPFAGSTSREIRSSIPPAMVVRTPRVFPALSTAFS
ncbi:hypothetical protein V0288_16555 [Pannus brasiliensis CCIBt3594]|uniref:Uncharacterized protein n=1 Tax=Pannus brasiliensis CCIBt3594 TaxID=1427578 RepID=A0AAW9QPD0_9CHRO